MSQPPGGDPYLRPPPPQRPYGAPPGYHPPPPGYGAPQQYGYPAPGYGYGYQQPVGSDGSPLAGPGWRLLARIIDGLIVFLIAAPVTIPLYLAYFRHIFDKLDEVTRAANAGRPAPNVNIYDGTTIRLVALIVLTSVVVSFLYEVPQLAVWGQTVGKRVCRVCVVRHEGPGKLGFGKASMRWLGTYGGSFVPFVGGIYNLLDSLWLLWDRPWQQCLHDKFAKTIVVRLPQ
ncbi:MAG: RDD family protein [Actinomycetota bacterium]|nr:RDD family protein [Actinomycetota bacterium]